jgi:hypothetical protein
MRKRNWQLIIALSFLFGMPALFALIFTILDMS